MEALVTTCAAAALAEAGDKTQLILIALIVRYGRSTSVLVGAGLTALAGSLVAAAGGASVHNMITLRATALLAPSRLSMRVLPA